MAHEDVKKLLKEVKDILDPIVWKANEKTTSGTTWTRAEQAVVILASAVEKLVEDLESQGK